MDKIEEPKKDGEQTPVPDVPAADLPQSPVTPPEQPITPAVPESVLPPEDASAAIPAPADVGYTETESNKLVYVFIGVLVVILLSLVGLFFYKQYTGNPSASVTPTPVLDKAVEESSTVTPVNAEESDAQGIDIPDVDEELKEIDTDLKAL
jgi:hypothetical protein